MEDKIDFSEKIHIGELIAVSNVYGLTPYTLLLELEKGNIELFLSIDEFNSKYSDTTDLDWCQLNNGKVFSKKIEE
ncbi:hypothetical protein CN514_16455 [Bacillus sp. AFS001701]|uniref:hypothetical protein n=1 Tax=Bacillaceae TaxID=186817 RepID=UPI000BF28D1A|nr:hypothetical protein [Bacillus sp. AFS001701]PET55604.1 hypothetical protein CN514_16455 [Bacillus sp. AFS001701]